MLHIHQSNNLHHLSDELMRQIGQGGGSVLQTEIVLVQNPGMKRYLQQRISQRRGIAANLQFPLPSRFIWDIFLSQFEDVQNLSAFDGEVLRWQLLTLLREHGDDEELRLLKPYLAADDEGLATFQLAEKLAALFDQYLVYRPQMIKRWEKSLPTQSANEAWQACLWRLLRAQNNQPHRADLIERLIGELETGQAHIDRLPARVFVFAISALSPLYLNVLAALGQHIDIHIFNHNPCAHYWGDVESKKEQLRRGENPRVVNELLASMGKQGRDYIDQFYQLGYDYEEHPAFVDIDADSLLKRIQQDILTLPLAEEQTPCPPQQDDSIQIVSCYSELRELQVLHDRLLAMLAQDETLQAHDIVVMCPDINRQAALIEAVFGRQPEHKRIPFSISDHNNGASAPLLQAILDWIRLSSSRLSVSEMLGWLELPALQRAYALDDDAIENIRYWIKSNHIHWAANRTHKSRLGFADTTINTWQHGINRLLTAYVMNDDVELFGQQLASEVMPGQTDISALGQLQRLLDDLQRWSQILGKAMTLQQWQQQINAMLQNLIAPDDEEEWQLKPLRETLSDWQQQAEQAGCDPLIDAAVVQHLLQNALQQGATHHHYLTGGINFCNLIPMRSLPFRIICLIGMGDDQFPRKDTPLQLDLISQHPQKGDRSSREDDRYLFLQSLVSAQQYFYISYVGKNRKDDSTLEPSVLVTELQDYIEQRFGHRLPIEQTALQAFSSENFSKGSYASQWYLGDEKIVPQPFDQAISMPEIDSSITLGTLIEFFKNPARYFMRWQLNMSLDEYDEVHDDDEVFSLNALARYQLKYRLVEELLENDRIMAARYLNSGGLAEQKMGELQLAQQKTQVQQLLEAIRKHPHFGNLQRFECSLDSGLELSGAINSFSAQGLLKLSLSVPKGRHLMKFWIEHCLLCATKSPAFSELLYVEKNRLKKHRFKILPKSQAQQMVQHMIDAFVDGQRQILPFYVDTAYEYETVCLKKDKHEHDALRHILQKWQGDNYQVFYEAQDIYWQTGMKNRPPEEDFFAPEFFQLSARLMKPLLLAMQHD